MTLAFFLTCKVKIKFSLPISLSPYQFFTRIAFSNNSYGAESRQNNSLTSRITRTCAERDTCICASMRQNGHEGETSLKPRRDEFEVNLIFHFLLLICFISFYFIFKAQCLPFWHFANILTTKKLVCKVLWAPWWLDRH